MDQAVKANPNSVPLLVALGELQAQCKAFADADATFHKVVAIEPRTWFWHMPRKTTLFLRRTLVQAGGALRRAARHRQGD